MILDDENILIQAAIDSAHYEMVDLGLSVKWANKNVGASDPEDTGLYFQWGNTVGYTADQVGRDKVFNWDNYKFGTCLNLTKYNSADGLKVLEPIDDMVTTYIGSQYRTPTIEEIKELVNNTTQTFIDIDGNEYNRVQVQHGAINEGKLKGIRFTGSNGNSIFMPASGHCYETELSDICISGGYWSSNLSGGLGSSAQDLYFYDFGGLGTGICERFYGLTIRGVEKIINES